MKECKLWREWGQGKERKTLYKFSYFQLIFPHWNNECKSVPAATQAKFEENFKTAVLSVSTILCTYQATVRGSLIHAYKCYIENWFMGWKLLKTLGKKMYPSTSWRLLPSVSSEEPKTVQRGWCFARIAERKNATLTFCNMRPPLPCMVDTEKQVVSFSSYSLRAKHTLL